LDLDFERFGGLGHPGSGRGADSTAEFLAGSLRRVCCGRKESFAKLQLGRCLRLQHPRTNAGWVPLSMFRFRMGHYPFQLLSALRSWAIWPMGFFCVQILYNFLKKNLFFLVGI
jgi:hypothetical protein